MIKLQFKLPQKKILKEKLGYPIFMGSNRGSCCKILENEKNTQFSKKRFILLDKCTCNGFI